MIKNDFEKYNEDDWLAKEIARENRISAWDLDEGKDLRKQHEDDCDARQLAQEHRAAHLGRSGSLEKMQGKLSPWFFIDLVAVFFFFAAGFLMREPVIFPGIFLFLCLNPGIFVWLFLFKRFPSKAYLKAVFLISLFLFLYSVFIHNAGYIFYLIRRFLK